VYNYVRYNYTWKRRGMECANDAMNLMNETNYWKVYLTGIVGAFGVISVSMPVAFLEQTFKNWKEKQGLKALLKTKSVKRRKWLKPML
jgi:hypothetical protein